MRKFLLAGAAAVAALVATPALAQNNSAFVGPRIGVTGGFADSGAVYGANVGVDLPVGRTFTVGADAGVTNIFDHNSRTLDAGARVGIALSPRALAYARGGYSNLDVSDNNHLDGYTLGGGLQFSLTPNTYLNAEYRYSNYEQGVTTNTGLVGLGLQF